MSRFIRVWKRKVHEGFADYPDRVEGKAIPNGIYDVTAHNALVNVGIRHDTAEFVLASIRRWRELIGQYQYPEATALSVTADGGGSNGYRPRVFQAESQAFANETGLTIHVSHFPPGTSKWNAIAHA